MFLLVLVKVNFMTLEGEGDKSITGNHFGNLIVYFKSKNHDL